MCCVVRYIGSDDALCYCMLNCAGDPNGVDVDELFLRIHFVPHSHFHVYHRQDDLINSVLGVGRVPQQHPWIVFTAGAMGAGKSRCVSWMATKGIFP